MPSPHDLLSTLLRLSDDRRKLVIHRSSTSTPETAAVDQLGEAVFVTTSVQGFSMYRQPDARPVFDRLQHATWVSRTWGDGYGYLLVATGRAEIMIDPKLNLWDAAALQPVIEEAGGKFFDWQGNATIHGAEAIATNGALADDVLALIG